MEYIWIPWVKHEDLLKDYGKTMASFHEILEKENWETLDWLYFMFV